MRRVCTPDKLVVEIDGVTGRRHNFRSGIAEVSDRDAKAIIKAGGFIPSEMGHFARGLGYDCKCGFSSWFRRCSRCGTVN